MAILTHIVLKIMLPIMILIAVGYIANKRLNLDSRTFARIFIYIFVPAIFFTKIYYASVPLKKVWFILAYVMAIQLLMLVIALLVTRVFAYSRSRGMALGNSLMFFNSGNYGHPGPAVQQRTRVCLQNCLFHHPVQPAKPVAGYLLRHNLSVNQPY